MRFPSEEDSGSFTKIFSGTAILRFESRLCIIKVFVFKYNSITIINENKAIVFINVQSGITMMIEEYLLKFAVMVLLRLILGY
ncbi:hypothetical protein GCM10007028_21330 [Algibacter mikhailovii]|uniref:Uncharacterized protein n=1 Tax=Algibacter mikhailovii TaxID=425498 RepID=A0A918VA58_9FLAO|nr:hypothetical protein GCM10007028_21330 [Algibacter mikhailovii]